MSQHNEVIDEVVGYESANGIAIVTMQRPEYHNAQNSRMTYALDKAFALACDDDEVKVIILAGEGRHFSAGHDIGTPGRDVDQSFERTSLWYDHSNKPGGEFLYAREQEVYLGMCRRWREIPKPTIAMVQGACIAGGLMLAWVCDLIICSEDSFFQDPVVRMGIPGVEYFAHVHELNPRIAKEFLFLGERMSAARAYEMGMVNRVVPRDSLRQSTLDIAAKVAQMPRLGLQLTKQAINNAEDLMGKRSTMDMVFGLHHFAHVHNESVSGDRLGGFDGKAMAKANKSQAAEAKRDTQADTERSQDNRASAPSQEAAS
ncbi:enoyl-CoA hydratase [Shewanella sp. NFH-SH190041]|uniref:enoyl-CoA hydratase n=1 Tax=Shewanella sp. NFH-SH190041 TaxID=2950245 RepID=UPI0021C3089B|nr:enoyl-CoA hydratase [Shewanella sp. NFH-SH190041]BDM64292.1 enoyl-CoA hydratase [Shewanella sp. NFH-SH190041]